MKKTIAALLSMLFAGPALAAGAGVPLMKAGNDVGNEASLQRGAKYFVNYCLGCHSLKYVRYSRLASDLGMRETQLMQNLMFTADKPGEMMEIAMQPADAERWFGAAPPDLSLTARARGEDWIYTYLQTFYLDEKRPFGVNNLILPNASMPHVLGELQGYRRAVFRTETDAEGNVHEVFERFETVVPGKLSPEEYDQVVRDIVNFLDYVAEPVQLERRNIGIGVLAFLLVFFLFAYFLKREYWKDVH
ncbi:MAG TPA: cytochrome c1 [Gammaproteobacteria bacterium]|nr:cytochrome c1 [Gammaproteobacteria bacterium]